MSANIIILTKRYIKSILLEFEFDELKSEQNEKKHGISFDKALMLWSDEKAIVVPAKTVEEEERYALIGRLNEKCYVAIFTVREYKYRIISVRRCRKNEEKDYEENIS